MANVNTKSCDNCGKLKGEVNHWWSIDANIKSKSMFIFPYNGEPENSHGGYEFINLGTIRVTACGLECLSILESKIKEGVNPLK